MGKSQWTEEMASLAKTMHAQGQSASQIAKAINFANKGVHFSRNAVIGKLTRLGMTGRGDAASRRKEAARQGQRARAASNAKKTGAPLVPSIKAAPPVKAHTFEPGPNAVPFIHRKPWQCPFPITNESGPMMLVCGEVSTSKTSYCSRCEKITYVPIRPAKPKQFGQLRQQRRA